MRARLCYRRPVNTHAWLVLLLVAGSGCQRSPAPAPAAAPAPAPAPVPVLAAPEPAALSSEEPCTLETPLVPGVPGSPGHLMPSKINPNGQSELSYLMRAMQAELGTARAAIEHGGKPAGPLLPRFRKIRCSWPTNPRDRNESFDALAQSYLTAVSGLDAAPAGGAAAAYERVLDGCRTCHEQSCSGALVAIEALRLPAPKP